MINLLVTQGRQNECPASIIARYLHSNEPGNNDSVKFSYYQNCQIQCAKAVFRKMAHQFCELLQNRDVTDSTEKRKIEGLQSVLELLKDPKIPLGRAQKIMELVRINNVIPQKQIDEIKNESERELVPYYDKLASDHFIFSVTHYSVAPLNSD